MANAPKRTRKRIHPTIRWSSEQTALVLRKIKQNFDSFEKPNSQSFYRKMTSENEILKSIRWDSVRYKVKNLKTCYTKACEWRNQTGKYITGVESEKTIREYIFRICPYWDELDELFGSRTNSKPVGMRYADDDTDTNDLFTENKIDFGTIMCASDYTESSTSANQTSISICTEPTIEKECIQAESNKLEYSIYNESLKITISELAKIASKCNSQLNSLSFLTEMQKEKSAMQESRLNIAETLRIDEVRLKEEELKIKRESLEIEKKKLIYDYEIRMAQIAADKEVRKFEIEMKYSNSSRNEKNK